MTVSQCQIGNSKSEWPSGHQGQSVSTPHCLFHSYQHSVTSGRYRGPFGQGRVMAIRFSLPLGQGKQTQFVCLKQWPPGSSVFGKNMEITDEVRNKTEAVTRCCYLPREARRTLVASDVFGSQGPACTLVFIRGGNMRRKSVVSRRMWGLQWC